MSLTTRTFNDFDTNTNPLSADYLVGVCSDGSGEFKTNIANVGAYTTEGGGSHAIKPLAGNNTASGHYSVISGGCNNTASGYYSNVAGGNFNNACGTFSNVAGGTGNNAFGYSSNVAGGVNNNASVYYSNVAGGQNNTASGYYSNVAGGQNNTASGYISNVAGGIGNTASGNYSSILGGVNNNVNHCNSHIIGSSISTCQADATHVNNLISYGVVRAQQGAPNGSTGFTFGSDEQSADTGLFSYNYVDGTGQDGWVSLYSNDQEVVQAYGGAVHYIRMKDIANGNTYNLQLSGGQILLTQV